MTNWIVYFPLFPIFSDWAMGWGGVVTLGWTALGSVSLTREVTTEKS
jgi:hypothetical protein